MGLPLSTPYLIGHGSSVRGKVGPNWVKKFSKNSLFIVMYKLLLLLGYEYSYKTLSIVLGLFSKSFEPRQGKLK
jgi:hypothetical protein